MIDLYAALLMLKTKEEAEKFLIDLCTPAEIRAFKERWKVAQLLEEGKMSYREISKKTGTSVTTVGRVARFLNDEPHQGYRIILNRVKR